MYLTINISTFPDSPYETENEPENASANVFDTSDDDDYDEPSSEPSLKLFVGQEFQTLTAVVQANTSPKLFENFI